MAKFLWLLTLKKDFISFEMPVFQNPEHIFGSYPAADLHFKLPRTRAGHTSTFFLWLSTPPRLLSSTAEASLQELFSGASYASSGHPPVGADQQAKVPPHTESGGTKDPSLGLMGGTTTPCLRWHVLCGQDADFSGNVLTVKGIHCVSRQY